MREGTRSVSEGSASTKVEGWDGGPTSPSQLRLPSGLNAGRGIPPLGLWPPDVTGMTDALATPAKGLHVQHASIIAPQSKPDAHRAEQIQDLQATILDLRQQVAQSMAREAGDLAHRAETAGQIEALQTELAGLRTSAQAQASASAHVPHLALSPARSSLGMNHNMPATPSPQRTASASLDTRKADVLADLDTANADASRLLAEHLQSPARPTSGVRASRLPVPLQTPHLASSPLSHAHAHTSPVPSAHNASAALQQRDELHCADLIAQVALLRRHVTTLQHQVDDLLPLKPEVSQLKAQMSSLERPTPPTPQAPTQTPHFSEARLAPTATMISGRPASSPLRPSGAVFSSPVPGGSHFRVSNRPAAHPTHDGLPSSPPSGTRQEGDPVDDVSGTALSELELTQSPHAGRVQQAPPPTHEEHTVDHSHDPKKCKSCTITRRAERKRKAEAKEAAAQMAAEAARLEAEAAATEALCERLNSLLATAEVGVVLSFVESLSSEDQTRLVNLHRQLVDEYFHQRQVYSTLSDEVKQLNPYELKHSITADRTADSLHALTEIAAKIDTLHQIMPPLARD